MGAKKCAPGFFPGPHADVRLIVCLRFAVPFWHCLYDRLAGDCRLPGPGTLDRSEAQPELDQRRILPPQCRRERRLFSRDGYGGGISRGISVAVALSQLAF